MIQRPWTRLASVGKVPNLAWHWRRAPMVRRRPPATRDVRFRADAKFDFTAKMGATLPGSYGPKADWQLRGLDCQKRAFRFLRNSAPWRFASRKGQNRQDGDASEMGNRRPEPSNPALLDLIKYERRTIDYNGRPGFPGRPAPLRRAGRFYLWAFESAKFSQIGPKPSLILVNTGSEAVSITPTFCCAGRERNPSQGTCRAKRSRSFW